MKLWANLFRRKRLSSALASALLLGPAAAATAQECEPLTAAAGPPPPGLSTYQLPDLYGIDLLGFDGSRVRVDTAAPAPTLTRTGVEAPLASKHWATLADLAVYNNAGGKNKYLLSTRSGELRLCRIESEYRGEPTVERFEYDAAGRLTAWQSLFAEHGVWRVSDHRCFNYDAGGRPALYASASEFMDCRQPKPGHIKAHYIRNDAGQLTRVIKFHPVLEGNKPKLTVVLFDEHGTSAHYIAHDWGGDPVQFPVYAENIDASSVPYNFIKLKSRHFEIELTDNGIAFSNIEWTILHGEADALEKDYLMQNEKVRVLAKGTADEKGRVLLSPVQKRLLWSTVNAYPDRTCLMLNIHCIPIRAVYPADEWARCIDPQQRDPAACRTH